MIGELLTIQTDIHHVERIIVIEIRNIREFTCYFLFAVGPLHANPILYFGLDIGFGVIFESYSNTFCVVLDQMM